MTHRLPHLLAALSLLLFAATAASWIASYRPAVASLNEFPNPILAIEHSRGQLRLILPLRRQTATAPEVIPFPQKTLAPGEGSSWSMSGVVTKTSPDGTLTRLQSVDLVESSAHRWFRTARLDALTPGTSVAAIHYRTGRTSIGPVDTRSSPAATFRHWASVTIPHPHFLASTALWPALAITRAIRHRHRNRTGRCPSCGYDLRATPDVCPECGRAPVGTRIVV